ncbi:heparan-alpha-glucosaminide N-acetyltransferase [Zongyangia hominis]|uniref:DUF1624 domain-containing protein n=1 Tax=Zongyangia hominis TaxID=2763677 RepID=A0A926ECN3_9FIRM|nr:heparan-alpha-glucosaminide N-acetyltransferase [Zongyangia hominis]MBC8571378.1 DUF1624 domain-containing protein [Zongyangia hominis]
MTTIQRQGQRVHLIDEIRGFAILCMVIYHGVYDLLTIFQISFPFFFSPFMNGLRTFFAGMFIFISGTACQFSHNNLKRGAVCLGLGLCITLFTALFLPSELIVFGILHMLGVSMMLYALLRPLLSKVPPLLGALVTLLLFIFTYGIVEGYVGIPALWELSLPAAWYTTKFLFPLGLLPGGFYSADYFSLLPWFFLFLMGSFVGVYVKEGRFPPFFYRRHSRLLCTVGRNTLLIYVLHQPVLYGLMSLIAMLIH